jgi:hypothetical protein
MWSTLCILNILFALFNKYLFCPSDDDERCFPGAFLADKWLNDSDKVLSKNEIILRN